MRAETLFKRSSPAVDCQPISLVQPRFDLGRLHHVASFRENAVSLHQPGSFFYRACRLSPVPSGQPDSRQGDGGQAKIIRFAPPGEVIQASLQAHESRVYVIPFTQ